MVDLGVLFLGLLLFGGLVAAAVVLGSFAARLFLDASRNGVPEPPVRKEARKGNAKGR